MTDISTPPLLSSAMVGTRIARARKRAHLKQVDLAAAMGDGTSRSAISMIKTGAMDPSFTRATEAALAPDVSLDYVAGITDDSTPADQRRSNPKLVSDSTNGRREPPLAPNGSPDARPIPIRELAAAAGGGALGLDETIQPAAGSTSVASGVTASDRPHAGRRHKVVVKRSRRDGLRLGPEQRPPRLAAPALGPGRRRHRRVRSVARTFRHPRSAQEEASMSDEDRGPFGSEEWAAILKMDVPQLREALRHERSKRRALDDARLKRLRSDSGTRIVLE